MKMMVLPKFLKIDGKSMIFNENQWFSLISIDFHRFSSLGQAGGGLQPAEIDILVNRTFETPQDPLRFAGVAPRGRPERLKMMVLHP